MNAGGEAVPLDLYGYGCRLGMMLCSLVLGALGGPAPRTAAASHH